MGERLSLAHLIVNRQSMTGRERDGDFNPEQTKKIKVDLADSYKERLARVQQDFIDYWGLSDVIADISEVLSSRDVSGNGPHIELRLSHGTFARNAGWLSTFPNFEQLNGITDRSLISIVIINGTHPDDNLMAESRSVAFEGTVNEGDLKLIWGRHRDTPFDEPVLIGQTIETGTKLVTDLYTKLARGFERNWDLYGGISMGVDDPNEMRRSCGADTP